MANLATMHHALGRYDGAERIWGTVEMVDGSGELVGRLRRINCNHDRVNRMLGLPVKRRVQIRAGEKFTAETLESVCDPVQPDLLAMSLFVVWRFYQHVGLDHGSDGDEVCDDGRLELMWCDVFRQRLVAKGRDIQEVVQGKQWRDMAAF